MRAYIEDWEILSMKKNDQITRTHFWAKYGGMSLYYIGFGERYSIDDDDIQFLKGDWYALIGNPDHPDETSTYHEYFCIHDDLFDRILETDQNSGIILKVIHKEPSFSFINVDITDSRSNMMSRSEMVSPFHQIQKKRRKQFHDYSQKLIVYFKLIIVNPPPKLTDQEKRSIATSFRSSSQYQCIEINTGIILTYVLNIWN